MAVVAGGLMALGSFLPWISITTPLFSANRNGMEMGGDGIITLVLGIATALIGFAHLGYFEIPRFLQPSTIITGLICGFIFVVDYDELNNRIDRIAEESGRFGSANVGAGLWTIAVGAVLAIVAGIILRRSDNKAKGSYGASWSYVSSTKPTKKK